MFKALVMLPILSILAVLAIATPASASRGTLVVPFEKHWVETNHYVGTTAGGGTIEMWLDDVSFSGNIERFSATLDLSLDGHALTATLAGQFNFSTGRVVLNGRVTDGWLNGAQIHEESSYAGDDPETGGPIFVGTVQLMIDS